MYKRRYFDSIPAEIVTLIAAEVKDAVPFESSPFEFNRWLPRSSTIESCCYVSKLFYAHFRPHLYASISLETVEYRESDNKPRHSALFFLEKFHVLLEREPQIGGWVRTFKIALVDNDALTYMDWAKWAAQDTHLAPVLTHLTKLREFHLFIAHAPEVAWDDFSKELQTAFAQVFTSKTLTHVDVRAVAFPPALLLSSPSLKELRQWYRIDRAATRTSLLKVPPDGESLPKLTTFASDDPLTLIPHHLLSHYPDAFQSLRVLRLNGTMSLVHQIQPFLSLTSVQDIHIALGVNRFVPGQPSALDFSHLKNLKHIKLSVHAVPLLTPPTSVLSSCLTTLTSATSLESFNLAMSLDCWDFNPLNPLPTVVNPNYMDMLRRIDTELAYLTDTKRYPNLQPIQLRLGCGCHSTGCRVNSDIAAAAAAKKKNKTFPSLYTARLLKVDVLGVQLRHV